MSQEQASRLPRTNGASLAYHKHAATGQGAGAHPPGIIFLGGFMSDMTGTKAVALERYAKTNNRDFLRFDYQGHGASSGQFVDGSIGLWTQDALAAIDALSDGPQILVGSSMGGWIALLAALARPEKVAAVVGIAAAPDFTETMRQGLSDAARAEIAAKGHYAQPSDYGEEPYLISRKLLEDGRDHLLLGGDIELNCPLRLLQGMCDDAVPWATALRIADKVTTQDVEVTLVKAGDHRLSSDADLARLFAVIDAL